MVEGFLLVGALRTILGSQIELKSVVDSKQLFSSLSTCKMPEDRSIRVDFNQIRYFFETPQLHKVV